MSDVNANIRIGVDSTQAISSLRSLQTQISTFNKSIIASNAQAMAAQSSALSGLAAQIGATKQFSTSIVNVESSVSRLGKAIDKNKLTLGEYFRYGTASTKSFGRVFSREHTQIMDLASDRVKRLQTQYIALSSAQNGMTKAMAVRPLNLFNADAAISVQRQQIFNKLLRDGSTSLINFGKNTQWAGRQLMVGFTVPLTIFGGIAGQIFMDLEKQIVNFRRVYGDAMTPAGETDMMIKEVTNLAKEFTKYGIAVKDTVGLASDVAAAGAQGEDLVAATAQSTRLATLGMIEMNQAMDATISLQTAFKLSNEELANSVNFLNAVENQTVLSLDDVTVAIPKVAPIIKGLGGDVQDLAFFLTAMREGGVNAAEGANALKSGLASLINPTKGAREQLEKVGINIDSIIKTNKGDIRATVQEFGNALMTLDKFSRQQTLAKVFGKYQFARLGALFENINRDGSQAQRVLDLTGQSVEDLANLAEKELGAIEESIGMKFTGAVERLKLALAPIGEVFLRIATPIIDFATKILDKFNELSPGIKQFISVIVAGVGVVVPTVIMLIGLFGNFIGQAIKGYAMFNNLFNRLRGGGKDLQHLSGEQLDAAAAASSLEGKTESLTSALNVQRSAVNQLARAYGGYVKAAGAAASGLPQGFRGAPRRMASGGMVPGSGNQDTVPALLTPGETVITKEATQKYAPILQAMNNGSLPGFKRGVVNLGGEQVELDFRSITSIAAIQRMFDSISQDAAEARQEFVNILRNMSEAEQISKKQVQEALRQSQAPELQAVAGERRYSASAAGENRPIQRQIQEDLGVSAQAAEKEYIRAQRVAQDAANELDNWYDQQINMLDENDSRRQSLQEERTKAVRAAAQVDRAHIVELTNQQKTERAAWDARLWMPQSGIENQLSNMLKSSESNKQVYSQYLMSLGDDVASEQDKANILRKINSNLALTEKELQIQKVVLDRILLDTGALSQTSQKFAPYARATSAAARSRAANPSELYTETFEQSRMLGVSAVRGVAEGAETASNSRATNRTGQFVAGGLEEGIRKGTPSAVAAAKQLRLSVNTELGKGIFPGFENSNAPSSPLNINDTGKEIDKTSKELSKTRKAIRGFGVKATGAMFAMDGLVFGASMMNNSMGEFAQKIMPAVFAIQGLAMMLPMLTSPVGAVAAGLIASAAAIWFFKSKSDEMTKNMQKLSDSMISTRATIDKVGEFYGTSSLVQRQSEKEFAKETGVTSEEVKKAKEFVASELGISMQEGLGVAFSKFGASAAADQFSANLASMVLQGVIAPEQAKAMSLAMAESLGNEKFGINVNGKLDELLGPGNVNLLESPLQLAIDIDEQNQKTVQNLTKDFSTLASTMQDFGRWTAGDTAAAFVPVYGVINTINKATLGWDNWFGQVARSARGILNPDDFEGVEAQLKSIGSLAGNYVAQSYDNLSAAKERYRRISKKVKDIDDEDIAAKKQARREAKEAKKDLDDLTQSVKDQENALRNMFASGTSMARTTVLEGMRESISQQFENDPAMKLAWDMISGQMGDVSQDVQFNINMGISSGELNPIAVQNLMSMFANPTEATATINFLINTQGFGTSNQMILNILNMQDPEIQKKAIIDLIVNTPEGLSQETLDLLDPTGQIRAEVGTDSVNQRENLDALKKNVDKTRQDLEDYVNSQDYSLMPDVVTKGGAVERARENLNYALELQRVEQRSKAEAKGEVGLSPEEIDRRAKASNEYRTALENLTDAEKEYDDAVKSASANDPEIKRLTEENTNAQNEYNKAVGTGITLSADAAERKAQDKKALGPLVSEFYTLASAIKSTENPVDITINARGLTPTDLATVNENLAIFNQFPPEAVKIAGITTIGSPDQLASLTEAYKGLESEKPKVVKEAVLRVLGDDGVSAKEAKQQLLDMGYTMEQFAKLPDTTKTAILFNLEVSAKINAELGNIGAQFDLPGLTPQAASALASQRNKFLARLNQIKENISELSNIDTGGGDDTGDGAGDGGGGSATKSWLEGLISETEANLTMFPGMIDKIKKKYKGIPEQIIEMIGGGEEGVKRAQELLNASKEKVKKLIADYRKTSIAQALQGVQARTVEARRGKRAESILAQQGFNPEDAKSLASNSEDAFAIIQASLTMTKKKFTEFLQSYRDYLNATKESADPNDALKDQIDALNKSFERSTRALDDNIEAHQEAIDVINEEIESIQELNDADQNIIRSKQRQIEMYEREIEAVDRLNEADQKRIDELQRQDEIRNRTADALSHELDLLSQQEEKIRSSYQERISSLDTVVQLNNRIMQQEKDRLGISQALASGDIYEATRAAQEMQQNRIRSSQDTMKDALQTAMENRIENLRTSGGLTREQAEEQIRQIKEQSYQTSLLIRDIEDKIYQRNLDLESTKAKIRDISDQIRDIEDRIYDRETLILGIQEQRLKPAEDALKNLQDQKSELKKILDRRVDELEIQIDQNNIIGEQKKKVDDLETSWYNVAVQIKKAMDLAKGKTTELGPMPTRNAGETTSSYQNKVNTWRSRLAAIEAEKDAAIEAATASIQNKFAGGKIMKYAAGNIVGNGSRDSVPSMLTPGEFVIRKSMVDKYGIPMLNKINQGSFSMPELWTGGSWRFDESTGKYRTSKPKGEKKKVFAPVYNNYSVNVSVNNPGASADQIANQVLTQIRQLENTQIRSGRGY